MTRSRLWHAARWLVLVLAILLQAATARAVQPDEVMDNPALETRARELSRTLRCMVCQNQSIDDSDAPLARDLRLLVRERIGSGDSDSQVIDFLVSRYGEFVLLRPRMSWHTALLWAAPIGVLIFGLLGLFWSARRRSAAALPPPLDAAEEQRLNSLLR